MFILQNINMTKQERKEIRKEQHNGKHTGLRKITALEINIF